MGELPDEFSCTITDWEYIYGLCRDVADDVKAADFEPDVVVALARGGWFGGRCLCDFLGLDDLASLKVEHYVGTAEKGEEAQVRYPLADGAVEGKDVLVVDDIADTGQSIETAAECVRDRDPSGVRTATLQLLQTSDHEPDFVGEHLDEWAWVVYPWNFVEDMIELAAGVMEKSDRSVHSEDDLRRLLREYHGVSRTELEIAQPNRLDEVTSEMERRGVVESTGDGWRLAEN
ncbi:phosphoribosyltransferase [Haloarcula salina]|uniref:Phosphoribosyltransferase n=1 Tax=Haloarcula salina TaxID=1429914 RepID=A0AA41FZC2_9EURY|nr:phosphoribosyltransferase [Haloarcula salina]MBV0901547.1 phosphoribosyltransferase [Haloarcula salina]